MAPRRRARTPRGLEDVVAGASSICFIDGRRGRLLYRGYDIADLAEHATFEEVAFLLWHGDLPTRAALAGLRADLCRAGALPPAAVELLRRLPREAPPMAVLRTMTSALAHLDAEAEERSFEADLRKAVRLTAQVPALAAAFHRLRRGGEPLVPLAELSHAGNYLYLLQGAPPEPETARMLDAAFILYADHEFNASTFAARVTAATLSDLHSAVTSALGTLKGPLHGGAGGEVMRLIERTGAPGRAEAVVAEMIAAGERIPGFGHRVYRIEDPRARVLRRMARRMGERAGDMRWYGITRKIEEATVARRPIHPNVDLYTASLYRAMAIPVDLYAATFAAARVAGWTAHVLEQYADNRLIRPVADYTGPPGRVFVPLDARG
jgi:citrate synthase